MPGEIAIRANWDRFEAEMLDWLDGRLHGRAIDRPTGGGAGAVSAVGVTRRAALDALQGVVLITPVDTGRARGGWRMTVGAPYEGEPPETPDKDGLATVRRESAAVNRIKFADRVFIVNSVQDPVSGFQYPEKLEAGSSNQAPNGMIGPTLRVLAARYRSRIRP